MARRRQVTRATARTARKHETITAKVSATPSRTVHGQPVTFKTTVKARARGAGMPKGTVTFVENGTTLGMGNLDNYGTASYMITEPLSIGSHSITAAYRGDRSFESSTSAIARTHTVGKSAASPATVNASPSAPIYGQAVTFSTRVSASPPGAGTPTGSVTFFASGRELATVNLDNAGMASFTIQAALSVGHHSITASYSGDDNFKPVRRTTGLTLTVAKADTSTSMTSSVGAAVFGQSITLTASVAVASQGSTTMASPGGTVTFRDGDNITIGQATLSRSGGLNTASVSTSTLAVGAHAITATYSGDDNFNTSSAAISQSVARANTTTATVNSSLTAPVYGQTVTFTTTVGVVAPGAGTPAGSVTFLDSDTSLGTGTLDSNGVASCTTTHLSVGRHSITAAYNGDGNFAGSRAQPFIQTVNPAISLSPVSSVKVCGKAEDVDKNPIVALPVQVDILDPLANQPAQMLKQSALTGPSGTFEAPVPSGSSVRVTFPRTNEGLILRHGGVVELQPVRDTTLATVIYEPTRSSVRGTVERELLRNGTLQYVAFPDVSVELLNCHRARVGSTKTGGVGEFCLFANERGQFTLRFQCDRNVGADLLTPTRTEIDVVLDPVEAYTLRDPVQYRLARAQVVGQVTDGKQGLQGVPVTLTQQAARPQANATTMYTDDAGYYRFPDLVPGTVQVAFPSLFTDDASNAWELLSGQAGQQTFVLQSAEVRLAAPVIYHAEEHTILWTVTLDNGDPAPDKLVELREKRGDTVLQQQLTDSKGQVKFPLAAGGDFQVWVYVDDRVLVDPLKKAVTVHSQSSGSTSIPAKARPSTLNGSAAGNGAVAESVIDQFAYPVLTEEVSFPTPAPRPSGAGAAGGTALGQVVDATLRDVLGWRPKTSDPKGFNAALTQSFTLRDVEGHTQAAWVQRSYAVQVQADLGAITGAQASIYARAKVALDQSLPLLAGLTSLRTDILPEDQEATRSIVRSELTQLINELGVEGGPRVQRVDELFGYLLGLPASASGTPLPAEILVSYQEALDNPKAPQPPFPGLPKGPGKWPTTHMGELGLRFGMQRGRVNTIEDEQDLTNFIILVDYITGLWQTWIGQRQYLSRIPQTGVQPYFGTQMVLLARALAVVAESVQEVNFTMDSVFLGPAERQTLELDYPAAPSFNLRYVGGVPSSPATPPTPPATQFLYHFPSNTSPLFLAELLDWVDRVASEEGPRLIQDAGKDGVAALNPTLDNLRTFARGALIRPLGVQDSKVIPKGYGTVRVQRAVRELADSLDDALKLAIQIQGLNIPNE